MRHSEGEGENSSEEDKTIQLNFLQKSPSTYESLLTNAMVIFLFLWFHHQEIKRSKLNERTLFDNEIRKSQTSFSFSIDSFLRQRIIRSTQTEKCFLFLESFSSSMKSNFLQERLNDRKTDEFSENFHRPKQFLFIKRKNKQKTTDRLNFFEIFISQTGFDHLVVSNDF